MIEVTDGGTGMIEMTLDEANKILDQIRRGRCLSPRSQELVRDIPIGSCDPDDWLVMADRISEMSSGTQRDIEDEEFCRAFAKVLRLSQEPDVSQKTVKRGTKQRPNWAPAQTPDPVPTLTRVAKSDGMQGADICARVGDEDYVDPQLDEDE